MPCSILRYRVFYEKMKKMLDLGGEKGHKSTSPLRERAEAAGW
jgi:hypothetical protein